MTGGTEGRGEPVTEGGMVMPDGFGFTLGCVTIRVEDSRGVQEIQSQPETATESAGADATGNEGD